MYITDRGEIVCVPIEVFSMSPVIQISQLWTRSLENLDLQ